MKRRDVEDHNRVQQQRERDQAAEAEKKEADEKLFEKQSTQLRKSEEEISASWNLCELQNLREYMIYVHFKIYKNTGLGQFICRNCRGRSKMTRAALLSCTG